MSTCATPCSASRSAEPASRARRATITPAAQSHLLIHFLRAPPERVHQEGNVQRLARALEQVEDLLESEGGGLEGLLEGREGLGGNALG